MRSKKGFAMSIGFIVTLILTIIIFAGSLYFLRQFYSATSEFQEQIGRQTEQQIRDLMTEGKIVVIPINRATQRVGEGNTFWLGVSNLLQRDANFEIAVEFNRAFDKNDVEMTAPQPTFTYIEENWILLNPGPHRIKNGEQDTFPIRIEPQKNHDDFASTRSGTYVFNVCVYEAGTLSGTKCDSDPILLRRLYTEKVYKIFVQIP